MHEANKVSWFELPVDDLDRATNFYSSVFGWATPAMGQGAAFAHTVAADEHGNAAEVGGINGGFHQRVGDADAAPVINISVDDVDNKLAEIAEAGGVVIQPRTDLRDFGLSMALFGDTEGNVLGVYARLS